jgi:hypothetical protein
MGVRYALEAFEITPTCMVFNRTTLKMLRFMDPVASLRARPAKLDFGVVLAVQLPQDVRVTK